MESKTLIKDLKPGKYIVAVSGGVDSISLLHMLSQQENLKLLVAHVNHGIRSEDLGLKDEELVKKLCREWNIDLEITKLRLGEDASEDIAREKRHSYLQQLQKSKHYNKIITAHHKDDVIETMIINILRGTGRKGLSSLKDNDLYLRPLIEATKPEILEYAHDHNLEWNVDSTNHDQTYLRNYVRLSLIPKLKDLHPNLDQNFHDIYRDMIDINADVDSMLFDLAKSLNVSRNTYSRPKFIMLPVEVSISLLAIFNSLLGD